MGVVSTPFFNHQISNIEIVPIPFAFPNTSRRGERRSPGLRGYLIIIKLEVQKNGRKAVRPDIPFT